MTKRALITLVSLFLSPGLFAQGTYTLLHGFSGSDGQQPEGMLTEVKRGLFYGTAITLFAVSSTGVFKSLTPVNDQNSLRGTCFRQVTAICTAL